MGWGQIKKRCPRCKKLRCKVRDRRTDRHWRRAGGALVCHICVRSVRDEACRNGDKIPFVSQEQATLAAPCRVVPVAYLCKLCGWWHVE